MFTSCVNFFVLSLNIGEIFLDTFVDNCWLQTIFDIKVENMYQGTKKQPDPLQQLFSNWGPQNNLQ